MAGSGKRDRAVNALVGDAEKAFKGGDVEAAGRLIGEAANLWLEKGEVEEAINLCISWRDYGRAGSVAEQVGDVKRAAQLYFRAGDFMRSASVRERAGEPMMAAELYERAGAWARAASIYETQTDFVRAAQLFERAGDKKRSADLLVRALTGNGSHRLHGPEASESCRRAAVLYAETGEIELAVRVLSWGGQTVFAGKLLADAGRGEEAIQMLVRAGDYLAAAQVARTAGDERRAQHLLGERAEREGRLLEAAAHYEEAANFAHAARLFETMGNFPAAAAAQERAGHFEQAAAWYERLGSIDDAARCLRAAGRETDARALLERANKKDDSVRRYADQGDFLRAAGGALALARAGERARYADAIAYLGQVGPESHSFLEARTLLAEIWAEQGEVRRGVELLQQLFVGGRVGPEHVPALYQYGRLLELEGFLAGARNAYTMAYTLDPNYRDLSERAERLRESDIRPSIAADLELPVVPAQSLPPQPVRPAPTLPATVGAPMRQALPAFPSFPTREPPRRAAAPRMSSTAMDMIDQQLSNMTGEISLDPLFGPSGSIPVAGVSEPEPPEALPHPDETPVEALESTRAEEPARPDSLVGVVLRGRFRIEKKLGKGAQAQVFLARDQVLDREVAIKVLNESVAADPQGLDRFLREARLAARVHHSSCIAIYDFGQEGGLTFMAMEYFRGRTLRDLVKRGPLDPYLALKIARDVAAALGAVHDAGIVHRDVKPTNVMVDRSGSVRVTDFGVARAVGDESQTGMMVGTMKYMAPEQARGKDADRRADIFSLGVVMFEMLSGEAPFGGTLDALIARVTKPPPELPSSTVVPALVRDLVKKCMQRKPAQRYPTMAPLLEDMERAISVLRAERRKARAASQQKNLITVPDMKAPEMEAESQSQDVSPNESTSEGGQHKHLDADDDDDAPLAAASEAETPDLE